MLCQKVSFLLRDSNHCNAGMTSLHRNLLNIPCQPQLTQPQAHRMQGVENPLLNNFPLGSNLSEWVPLCISQASGCTAKIYIHSYMSYLRHLPFWFYEWRQIISHSYYKPIKILRSLTLFCLTCCLPPRSYALCLTIFLEMARCVTLQRTWVLQISTESYNGFPFVTARSFKLWSSVENFKLEKDWLAWFLKIWTLSSQMASERTDGA